MCVDPKLFSCDDYVEKFHFTYVKVQMGWEGENKIIINVIYLGSGLLEGKIVVYLE